jgi:predicted acetyltransferase
MLSSQADLVSAEPAHRTVLSDLLHLYACEFSAFHPVPFGGDGRFVYLDLPKYWLEPHKHPFLIEIGGETAGFALVQQTHAASGDDVVWDIAEFFVLKEYRRRGVGIDMVHRVWKRFPGKWQVRVLQGNEAAVPFWDLAILRFTGQPAQSTTDDRDGDRWQVFSFESSYPR